MFTKFASLCCPLGRGDHQIISCALIWMDLRDTRIDLSRDWLDLQRGRFLELTRHLPYIEAGYMMGSGKCEWRPTASVIGLGASQQPTDAEDFPPCS